jgi:hypothetical protein
VDKDQRRRRAQLFTLRLWAEEVGPGQIAWRGKVQHVSSGQALDFRDWGTLIAHLQAMLSDAEQDRQLTRLRPEAQPEG